MRGQGPPAHKPLDGQDSSALVRGGSAPDRAVLILRSHRFEFISPIQTSSSLDHVSLASAEEVWAAGSGFLASAELARLAALQTFCPQALAERFVEDYEFLDPTFSFSFAAVSPLPVICCGRDDCELHA